MAQFCKDLDELAIDSYHQDLPGLISLIDAQRNLKGVRIDSEEGTCKELGKALARKGNTINELHIYSTIAFSFSFLTSLVNLKILEINESYDLKQYLAISEFPDLEHFSMFEGSCFKELAMLIEKTNGNILSFDIYTSNNRNAEYAGMLINAIYSNCPKIKILYTYLNPKDFVHIKLLLLNCRYLEYIWFCSLDVHANGNDIGDELLDILTKFSPNSLTEIFISQGWKYSVGALEKFFESCKERTLLRFGFVAEYSNHITKDHNVIIERYVNEGIIKNFV